MHAAATICLNALIMDMEHYDKGPDASSACTQLKRVDWSAWRLLILCFVGKLAAMVASHGPFSSDNTVRRQCFCTLILSDAECAFPLMTTMLLTRVNQRCDLYERLKVSSTSRKKQRCVLCFGQHSNLELSLNLNTVPLILWYPVHELDRQIFTSSVMSCISAYAG